MHPDSVTLEVRLRGLFFAAVPDTAEGPQLQCRGRGEDEILNLYAES